MSRMEGFERIGTHLGLIRMTTMASLLDDWANIPFFSEHSQPGPLTDGTLVVFVPDGPAASLLKFHTAELVGRFDGVERISIRVKRGMG